MRESSVLTIDLMYWVFYIQNADTDPDVSGKREIINLSLLSKLNSMKILPSFLNFYLLVKFMH